MRWTVPSTTAPTSMSAIRTPLVQWGPRPRPTGRPLSHQATGSVNGQYSASARVLLFQPPTLAVGLWKAPALRHGDEGDLAGFDHTEALPGDPLEFGRILEPLNPTIQATSLLHQDLDLSLQGPDPGPLGQILAKGNDGGRHQHEENGAEKRGPSGEARPNPGDGLGSGAHRPKLQ